MSFLLTMLGLMASFWVGFVCGSKLATPKSPTQKPTKTDMKTKPLRVPTQIWGPNENKNKKSNN